MKIEELRIGNYIQWNNFTEARIMNYKDFSIVYELLQNEESDSIKPIQTTEEYILRFGFKEIKNEPRQWFKIKTKKRGVSFEIDIKRKRAILFYHSFFIDIKYPKYIHELQNAFFAITGTELILK